MTPLSLSICELIGQFKRRSSLIGIYASLASSPFQTAGSKGRKEIIFVDQRKILRKKSLYKFRLTARYEPVPLGNKLCTQVEPGCFSGLFSTVTLIAAKIFP